MLSKKEWNNMPVEVLELTLKTKILDFQPWTNLTCKPFMRHTNFSPKSLSVIQKARNQPRFCPLIKSKLIRKEWWDVGIVIPVMWVILPPWEVDEVVSLDPFLEGVVPQKEPLEVRQDQGLKSQCGNFRIFLLLRFYVKSILENVEVLKLLFCNFRGFQKSKFRVINELKWQIFNF